MKNFLFLLSSLVAAHAVAQTGAPLPENFTHRTGIALSGAGPFHQVALPLAVYQSVQRADLGDLRVFNGQGEAVPHALLRSEASSERRVDEKPAPLFPIVSKKDQRGHDGDLSVEVRRHADGTLIAVRQSATPAKSETLVRGVIADASKFDQGVRSLRLSVGPAAAPFHFYSIETSDDLQQWRMLKRDAQLVQLEHDGRRIEKNTVEWGSDAGKYLRILWSEPQQAPAIRAVTVGIAHTEIDQAPMLWSTPILPAKIDKNHYDYALPGRMPLEQLRIDLPQVNTLAPLQVQQQVSYRHRQREQTSWQTIADTVAFRLQSPQGEVRSPDIVLNYPSQDRLRLALDARGGGLGKTPPSLQVGFVPHVLVFLPRGEGPFSLAWGAADIGNAALPVATLVPGYGAERKLSASPATLHGAPPLAAAAAAKATDTSPALSKAALWAILIAGVLVLGGMVWGLFRQMKQDGKDKD